MDTDTELSECARVFIQKTHVGATFIFNCSNCCEVFLQWYDFTKHFMVGHLQLVNSTFKEMEETNAEIDDLIDDSEEYVELQELQEEVEAEMDNLHDENAIEKNNKETYQLLDAEEEHIDATDEIQMLEQANAENAENVSIDFQEEYSESVAWSTVTDNEANAEEHYDSDHNSNETYGSKSNHIFNEDQISSFSINSRAFYNMQSTPTEIMLDFIEIIKDHECLWNYEHNDYGDKQKQQENADEISELLLIHWSLDICTELIRTSILTLRRWFEMEYVKHLRNKMYTSKFNNYYTALLQYMPYKHLRSLICDECDRQFRTESCLLQHKHKAHNAPLPYSCRYCGRGYLHMSVLKIHENRHTKGTFFQCEKCDYQTPSKNDLLTHQVKHTGERAYICNLCGFSYKSSTSLAVHKRKHKAPTLQCQHCDKKFYEPYRLKRHIKLKHID